MIFYDTKSEVHGHGCFAHVLIPEGMEFWLPTYKTEEWTYNGICDAEGRPRELYAPFRYLNHSTQPNADLFEGEDSEFYLVTLEEIFPDEEIKINYGPGWSDT